MKSVFALIVLANIVSATEEEDEIELGKLVAWCITGFVLVLVGSMLLAACICTRLV